MYILVSRDEFKYLKQTATVATTPPVDKPYYHPNAPNFIYIQQNKNGILYKFQYKIQK